MIATIYILLFILAVIAITYPKEFPQLVRNPDMLLRAIGMETRRRWMIARIGSMLFIERKQLQFSLWRNRKIIEQERLKQREQNTHD